MMAGQFCAQVVGPCLCFFFSFFKGRPGKIIADDWVINGGRSGIGAVSSPVSRQLLAAEKVGGEVRLRDNATQGLSIKPDRIYGGIILCVGKGIQLSLQKEAATALISEMKMHNGVDLGEFRNEFSSTEAMNLKQEMGFILIGGNEAEGGLPADPFDLNHAIATWTEEEGEGWGLRHPLVAMGPQEEGGYEGNRTVNEEVESWLRSNVEEMGQSLGLTYAGEKERTMGIFGVLEGKQKFAGRKKNSS